ncbi:MAG TPA: hypothetical protein VF933_11940 [Streptosporangiaceae bacterium]
MTRDAAAVAVIVALLLGYYWARWRRAEASAKGSRLLAEAASRAAWRARGMIVLVGVAVYVALHTWLGGR